MNVKILDREDIRESVPIEIEIQNTQGRPTVYVQNLGSVDVQQLHNKYLAQFWVMEKGNYQITIKDQRDIWNEALVVKEQSYLTFRQEFSFFLILLVLFTAGIILWMKKLKRT